MFEDEKRTKKVTIRLTEEEEYLLNEEICKQGVSKSRYIRNMLLDHTFENNVIYTKEFRNILENITESGMLLCEGNPSNLRKAQNQLQRGIRDLWLILN